MYISPWPGLTPQDFLQTQTRQTLPYPLGSEHKLSFCVARSGIYHLFQALRLKPGETVAMPDYHSGNEVSAIHAAGAKMAYYPVMRNLEPDLEAIRRLARSGARVIYVIHYLGWSQPLTEIAAICRENGCILIEDCALSLLSQSEGKPLGTTGDYSVFCLYKTLPVPNGGLLVQNRNLLGELGNLKIDHCPTTTTAGRVAELAFEAVRSRLDVTGKVLFGIKRLFGRMLRAASVRQVPIGNIGWELGDVNVGMAAICQRVMNALDYEGIRQRRRDNYLRLRRRLEGRVRMLREDLADGVCPLFFPILVKQKHAVASALWQRGISAVEFWNDSHPLAETGPDARFLRSHVLELPIHQDVSPAGVDYIANQLMALKVEAAI